MSKCLIVVDYQVDFVCGSLGFKGAELLENVIADKINEYHKNNDKVIFTFDTHQDNYLKTQEGINLPIKHCVQNSDGHKLYGKIANLRLENDLCFYKHTFGSDKLFDYLRANIFESIELCGLVSNICVLSNAVLAKTAQPETTIIIDKNCTASNDEQLNKEALDIMKNIHINIL